MLTFLVVYILNGSCDYECAITCATTIILKTCRLTWAKRVQYWEKEGTVEKKRTKSEDLYAISLHCEEITGCAANVKTTREVSCVRVRTVVLVRVRTVVRVADQLKPLRELNK